MSGAFERFAAEDVRNLIAEYPLAWLVARDSAEGSLLPLLGEYDEAGQLVSLLGHLGRRNPLHARLATAPAATILINGPHGYVSPDHAGLRNWGPTWNYAQLVIAADVRFLPEESEHALEALVREMEGERWTRHELGDRYNAMAGAIIAFRARVTSLHGQFKLGQDETQEVFDAICRSHPNAALVRWMRRFHR